MTLPRSLLRTTFAAALLACSAHAAQADQLDDIRKSGKLRVAVAIGIPLFSFTDAAMEPTGSDVETARELARGLGVKLEVVPVTTAARISTLQARRADMTISVMSITEERAKVVDFSVPYAAITIITAAPRDVKIAGYADLAGKRIGLTRATTNDTLTTKEAKGAEIMRYEDDATLITSAVTGQVNIFSATPSTMDEINRRAPGKNFEIKFSQLDSPLGIALNKGEPRLKEWVDRWVSANLESGKLNQIYRKYHGRDMPNVVVKTAQN